MVTTRSQSRRLGPAAPVNPHGLGPSPGRLRHPARGPANRLTPLDRHFVFRNQISNLTSTIFGHVLAVTADFDAATTAARWPPGTNLVCRRNPCVWTYFAKNWGLCDYWRDDDARHNRRRGGALGSAAGLRTPHRAPDWCVRSHDPPGGSGAPARRRRKDCYVRGTDGERGALRRLSADEIRRHECPPEGGAGGGWCGRLFEDRSCAAMPDDPLRHLRLRLLSFKADFATISRLTWLNAVGTLAEEAVHMYDVRWRIGADFEGRRCFEFEGYMTLPCKEQDMASFPPDPNAGVPPAPQRTRPYRFSAAPGSNSPRRSMEGLLHVGSNASTAEDERHAAAVRKFGLDAFGRDVTQLAAEAVKQAASAGGPRYLILGPQVMNYQRSVTIQGPYPQQRGPGPASATPPLLWQRRLADRAPPTRFDWTHMARLEVLMIDFFDLTMSYLNGDGTRPPRRADLRRADLLIERTLLHIRHGLKQCSRGGYVEGDSPGKPSVRRPGLRLLVLSGLRTRCWSPEAAAPDLASFDPFPSRRRAYMPNVHRAEQDERCPWGTGRPNWIRICRDMLREDGGKLILVDIDMNIDADPVATLHPWDWL